MENNSNDNNVTVIGNDSQQQQYHDDDNDTVTNTATIHYMSNNVPNQTVHSIISGSSSSLVVMYNFVYMSILFSFNHGCVVACLSLATSQLGAALGSYQSGLLYITYSISGLFGSTYVVKELGSRNALIFGMGLYCVYVFTFYVATTTITTASSNSGNMTKFIVTLGALFGGWGAGFLWTAQGSYFTRAAQLYHSYHVANSHNNNNDIDTTTASLLSTERSPTLEDVTARFASIFAFIYLLLEIGLRSLSTIALSTLHLSWSHVFAIYVIVAVVSTTLMFTVLTLPEEIPSEPEPNVMMSHGDINASRGSSSKLIWYKATAAWRLLRTDHKMKYMIGLNAIFGLTAAFLTSYVNGTVVRYVLGSDSYVGLLTAWISCVAAVSSVLFGAIASTTTRKGYVLVFGALCFMCVAGSFIVFPNISPSNESNQKQQWHWLSLVGIYTLHGIGRSTFEGTLKSTFADYFAYEKEGAFANIILQNGISSAIGFALTSTLKCSQQKQERWGQYCVVYKDGSSHDVLTFELLIVLTAVLAIIGYQRASAIRRFEVSQGVYETVPNTLT